MQGIRFPTGFRFRPSREQLVGYYLFNKIYGREGRPFDSAAVLDCDLYSMEPWKIYERFDGKNGRSLFFFTPLKKKTDTNSRNQRKIANGVGTWHGQNLVESFEVKVEDFGIITASKRRFTFKKTGSVESGCWGMIEYSSSLSDEIVVCELINTGIRDARLGRKRKNPMIHERGSTKIDVKRMRVREANENQLKAALLRVKDVGETDFAGAEENGDDAGQFLDCFSFEGCGLVAESFNPSSSCGEETTFVSKADSVRAYEEDSGGLAQLLNADDYRSALDPSACDLNHVNSQNEFWFPDEGADYGATTNMSGCFSNWVHEANENPPKATLLHVEDVGETGFSVAEENGDDAGQFLDCLSFEGCGLVAESFNPSSGCEEETTFVSKADSGRAYQEDSGDLAQLLDADDYRSALDSSACDLNHVNSQNEFWFPDEGADYGATTNMSGCFSNWVHEANENPPKATLLRVEDIGETASMAAEENDDDDIDLGQILDCMSFEGCGEVAESFDPSPGFVEATSIVSEGDLDRVHQEDFESLAQQLAADDVVFDYCCPSSVVGKDTVTPSYDLNDQITTERPFFSDGGAATTTTASSCASNWIQEDAGITSFAKLSTAYDLSSNYYYSPARDFSDLTFMETSYFLDVPEEFF